MCKQEQLTTSSDLAEAKQLERAVSESSTSSCENTYSSGWLELQVCPCHDHQPEDFVACNLHSLSWMRVCDAANQVKPFSSLPVDAASADNSTLAGAYATIFHETNKVATSPTVKQQVIVAQAQIEFLAMNVLPTTAFQRNASESLAFAFTIRILLRQYVD